MAKYIFLRFDGTEQLPKLIEEACRYLDISSTALAKIAIFEYCKNTLEKSNDRQ